MFLERGLRPVPMTIARNALLGALAALSLAAPASVEAAGLVESFAVTPASLQAGGNPDVTADMVFDYGASATDSVKSFTMALAPGLLAAVANVPATCSQAQLGSDTCPAGSQVGT